MKKTAIAAALLCLTASFTAPSFAADPCEVVLCVYGKATGNCGGSSCSSCIFRPKPIIDSDVIRSHFTI